MFVNCWHISAAADMLMLGDDILSEIKCELVNLFISLYCASAAADKPIFPVLVVFFQSNENIRSPVIRPLT